MSARHALALSWALLALPAAAVAAVATTSYSAAQEGPHPQAVRVAPADGGQLITVKLAGLAKGARIHRARLKAARGEVKEAEDLLAAIEIFAGKTAAGKPLALAGPGYDAFDVTEAVRRALAGEGELNLLVKTFPGWLPERTRLEVSFEGKPAGVPAAVGALSVFHRAGATFINFKEVDPLVAAEKLSWGEYKQAIAEAKEPVTYRVYAHSRPIDAETIAEAELLGEVGPLSCWNVNGRNMEYLIGQAMIKTDEMGELARNYNGYMYTWGADHARMDRYPLERFVVDEKAGPLPPGTGLYVHHPAAAGKRYYAVVSCRGGVENTADFAGGNSLSRPVDEAVGPGRPVLQGDGLWGPFFDYPGKRRNYVQWCGPPLSPRPNTYFNWSVLVPPGLKQGDKAPVELYFHGGNFSYAKPRQKYVLGSIQIAPHDFPFSGWYGFNDAFGTLKPYSAGKVSNHTQKRIVAFLEWAAGELPMDPERIVLSGSDGAAMLAVAYPDTFAYVLVNGFRSDVLERAARGKLQAAWGPRGGDVADEHGRTDWQWAMLDELVLARRGQHLPLFVCRGYSWGPFVKQFARGEGRFYDAMRKASQPIVADWTWASGQLVKPDKYTGLWRGLDITRRTPMPAFANCSLDRNTEGDGQTNLHFGWQEIKDEPDSVVAAITCAHREATFELALRRLRNFKVKPGERLRWAAAGSPTRSVPKPEPQNGTVIVDKDGLFPINGLKVNGQSTLTVKVTRGE